jgi:hypothetical protein
MTTTELLSENRAMGWPDISQSLAPAGRQKFAAKIAEFRRRAIANPAEYRSRCEREERSALTTHVRKVNPLPVSVFNKPGKIELSLEERLLVVAGQIRADNEALRVSEEARWANDASYQAWLASAERFHR